MGKGRESDKVSHWGIKNIPQSISVCVSYDELRSSTSLLGGQVDSKCHCDENCKERLCPSAPPWGLLAAVRVQLQRQCWAPQRAMGWTRCSTTVCFFQAGDTFIRKPESGKTSSIQLTAKATRLAHCFASCFALDLKAETQSQQLVSSYFLQKVLQCSRIQKTMHVNIHSCPPHKHL